MADQTMTVTNLTASITDLAAHANSLAGNAAGADWWYMPNDGHTVLLVDAVTGDTWTFTAVADKFGRTETYTLVLASGKWGTTKTMLPELWNQSNGCVKFKPTVGNAGDKLLAVRIP
jgi:hypothetical protein